MQMRESSSPTRLLRRLRRGVGQGLCRRYRPQDRYAPSFWQAICAWSAICAPSRTRHWRARQPVRWMYLPTQANSGALSIECRHNSSKFPTDSPSERAVWRARQPVRWIARPSKLAMIAPEIEPRRVAHFQPKQTRRQDIALQRGRRAAFCRHHEQYPVCVTD